VISKWAISIQTQVMEQNCPFATTKPFYYLTVGNVDAKGG
jgi:hypothetical protein